MTIREYRDKFYNNLGDRYESGEVEMFFRLLAEAYLDMSRIQISLNLERELSEAELSRFESAKQRLFDHEPIQYIIGQTEFYGLPMKVDRNVLIPRPETEELVEWILHDLKSRDVKNPRVLDIGTGSGCIAISLAKNLKDADVTALDVSEGALEVAKTNAAMNEVSLTFELTDILVVEKLSSTFDVIVSNPPYVRELEKHEIKPNVLENEPETALFVKDEDPLLFYEKITKLAQTALKENGSLYFEINQYLGKETEELLQSAGFKTELRQDFLGNDRMLKGIL